MRSRRPTPTVRAISLPYFSKQGSMRSGGAQKRVPPPCREGWAPSAREGLSLPLGCATGHLERTTLGDRNEFRPRVPAERAGRRTSRTSRARATVLRGKTSSFYLDGYDQRAFFASHGLQQTLRILLLDRRQHPCRPSLRRLEGGVHGETAHGLAVWAQAMVQLRMPMLFNLVRTVSARSGRLRQIA